MPARPRTHASYRPFLLLLAVLVLARPIASRAEFHSEFEQKASLICGLLRNVEWPLRKLKQPNAPFVIGIIGRDTLSEFLREDLQNRKIKDRPVQIRTIVSLHEIPICHLLFVSESEGERVRSILTEARREGILTVGESDNFLSLGGIVQFVIEGPRVTYRVNQTNANRESLRLNGFVLRLSRPQSFVHPKEVESQRHLVSTGRPGPDPE